MTTKKEAIITIRWFDGYIETFEAKNYRFGKDLLWLVLEKSNRHIPLRDVRWFSVNPESHE